MKRVYLVAYDICLNDKIRYKLSNFLSVLGIRIQRSVFLLYLSPRKIEEVKRTILKIAGDTHRILIIEIENIDTILGEYLFTPFDNIIVLS